jgi:uncharacterized protein (TIGR02246 family)
MAARLRAESDSARTAIVAVDAALARYVAAGQADSFAQMYAEDAVQYPSGKPARRGRAAILENTRTGMAAGAFALAVTPEKVEASGPIAIATGRYITTFTPGPNAPVGMNVAETDTVKYVVTLRKVGGRWLISNQIGTTDRAPQPAPTRRR